METIPKILKTDVFEDIELELKRATEKHPNYPEDMFKQLAIMQEEAGEVTKAVLEYSFGKCSINEIRKELIETAAMCVRMLNNLKHK